MDDQTMSAATHGLAVLGGGTGSAWIVKLLFGGIIKRLEKIEHTLERLGERHDKRHEEHIKELGKIEMRADAAFRNSDALKPAMEKLEAKMSAIEDRMNVLESRRRK